MMYDRLRETDLGLSFEKRTRFASLALRGAENFEDFLQRLTEVYDEKLPEGTSQCMVDAHKHVSALAMASDRPYPGDIRQWKRDDLHMGSAIETAVEAGRGDLNVQAIGREIRNLDGYDQKEIRNNSRLSESGKERWERHGIPYVR